MTNNDFFNYKSLDFRRSNTFYVVIGSEDNEIVSQYVKSVTLPSATCEFEEVRMGGFARKIPSRNTFDDLSMTLYDTDKGEISLKLYEWFNSTVDVSNGLSNHNLSEYTKTIYVYSFIENLNNDNTNQFDNTLLWTFKNAWISSINFGSLDYSSADNIELEVTFTYQYFTLTNGKSV